MAYKTLADESQLTPENLRLAQYLGWCVEMVSSFSRMLSAEMTQLKTNHLFVRCLHFSCAVLSHFAKLILHWHVYQFTDHSFLVNVIARVVVKAI